MAKIVANSGDPDQTPRSVASDLGLHCLPIIILGVSSLQWVKQFSHACISLPFVYWILLVWRHVNPCGTFFCIVSQKREKTDRRTDLKEDNWYKMSNPSLRKNITYLSSAEFAHSMAKVNIHNLLSTDSLRHLKAMIQFLSLLSWF